MPDPDPTDPSARPSPSAPLPGAAALLLVGLLLLPATALALHQGLRQIDWLHGTLVVPDSASARFAAAAVSEISGAPTAWWLASLTIGQLLLLRPGARTDERGRRARGGLVLLGGLLLVGGLSWLGIGLAQSGALCPEALCLVLVYGLSLGLSLVPPGGRRPAWPQVEEWLPGLILGLTSVMAFGFGARILVHKAELRRDQVAPQLQVVFPPDSPIQVEEVAGEALAISPTRSPAPIDDQDAAVGPRRAKTTAVAFLDLSDPASRALAWQLMELEPAWSDRVRFVYKHLPMDASCNPARKRTAHPRACALAVALQCAAIQGGYPNYRRLVLRNPDRLGAEDLRLNARQAGLDEAAFLHCQESKEAVEAVEADIKQAGKGVLDDPPWLFIEGRVVEGAPAPGLIEATLAVAAGERSLDASGRAESRLQRVTDAPLAPGPVAPIQLGRLWIDAVEASLDASGAAVSVAGARPWPVSLDQARAACAAAGRQLCSRQDWLQACQGVAAVDEDGSGSPFDDRVEGRLQPYGDPPRSGWCADGTALAASGSHPGCRSPEGAWDLAGNMQEWVEEGLLLGGGVGSPAGAVGCQVAEQAPGPGWRTASTGFRCCGPLPGGEAPGLAAAPPPLPAPRLPEALDLPPELVAAPGGLSVVAWQSDCAGCQRLLHEELALGRAVVLLDLSAEAATTALWLERAGLSGLTLRPDPQARLAGSLGVSGLPWRARYGPDGRLESAGGEAPLRSETATP